MAKHSASSRRDRGKALPPSQMYQSGAPTDKRPPEGLTHVFSFATDLIDAYRAETLLLNRRRMLWMLTSRSPSLTRAANNLAMSLGSRDVLVSPSVSNPSASDVAMMEKAVATINASVRRAGFFSSLAAAFVDGLLRSQTGAFILPTRTPDGAIEYFDFLDPLQPRPFYGVEKGGSLLLAPRQPDNLDVQGIWYYAPLEIKPFANDDYYQAVYGAYGSGKWLMGEPPSERILLDVADDVALADYARRAVSGTDLAQIVTISNADMSTIEKWREKNEVVMERRARGEVVSLKDMPRRLVLAKPNGSMASDDVRVNVYDMRLFPKDFNLSDARNRAAHAIAQGLGISPRWTAIERAQERSGNATQSALINSDEPGMDTLERAFASLLSRMLLDGVNATIRLQSESVPENFARLSADRVAAETAQKLIDSGIDKTVVSDYLLRAGVLLPADVGNTSYSLSNDGGTVGEANAKWLAQKSIAPARLTDGARPWLPFVKRASITLTDSDRARVLAKEYRIDDDFEACTRLATARYENWVETQMPSVIDDGRLNTSELRDDVDSITRAVVEDIVQCGRRYAAQARHPRINVYLDHLRYGLYNRWGSPALQTDKYPKPRENLFSALRALSADIARGRASADDLKRVAYGYEHDIQRYFASASALAFINLGVAHDGAVKWVLDERAKHCSECPRYAGEYVSFLAMLGVTAGKVPRDIRLQCSGGCRCRLERA